MIGAIQNIISSPTLYNATQNTVAQVTTETCLKAIGRPGFILADKQIDPQTKKFSATKEFLYQLTCLGIYLALIAPVFKKGGFSVAKKFYKDEPVFKAFNKADEFIKYLEADAAGKQNILKEINKNIKTGDKFTKENINEDFAKGAIGVGSITGTVLGLAILAPILSHPIIHPVLKVLGMDKPKEDKAAPKVA